MTFINKSIRSIAFGMAVLGAGAAHAQFVNASFEDPAQSPSGLTTNGINGWSSGAGAVGVWYTEEYLVPVPDGNQIGYTNGSPVAQQSTAVLGIGRTDLTMWFGNRFDGDNGIGTLELWAGGSTSNGAVTGGTLLDSVVVNETAIAAGHFQQFDAFYVANPGDASLGELLTAQITLTSGPQMDFDLAQINAAPEPASIAALGLGALGLLRRRRAAAKR